MGRETSTIAAHQIGTTTLKGRTPRITVKPCNSVILEAPTLTVREKEYFFLRPFDSNAACSSSSITATPLLSDVIRIGAACLPKLDFRGWTPPGLGWEAWVMEMACDEKIVSTWRKAGIEDAIRGSVTNIKPDQPLLQALCGFWCPVNRTFIFPWGEAAFTLEDAHVIGNLSISGSKLDRELTDEEEDLRIRLYVEKEKIWELHPNAKAARRVTLDIWLQWFLELQGEEELKNLGFLAYWLAKNVVPAFPFGEVPEVIFRLAARLYCGDRIALAPLVTANIYRDLSSISNFVLSKSQKRRGNKLTVWAQFGLLQAWVWARFESLCPLPHGAGPLLSESHITRLGSRRSMTKYDEALDIFRNERSYTWRPYSKNFSSWKEPTWCDQEARIIRVEEGMPTWVYDYVTTISPTMLQGFYGDSLITSERYQPHRVARQFGYDQAIPISNDSLALWIANKGHKVGQYVSIPETTRSGNPCRDYLLWWQKYKVEYQKALNELEMQRPDLVGIHKKQTKPKGKSLQNGFTVNQSSFEASYQRNHCQEQEEKEGNNVLAEPRDHTKIIKEKNEETFNLTESQEADSDVEIQEYDSTRSKSSCNESHQCAKRKRKLEVEDISKRAEVSSVPFQNVIIIDDSDEDVNSEEEVRMLVDELEEFQHCGLLNEWDPSFPELGNEDNSNDNCSDDARNNGDPFGQEAVRMYPQFFELIPQKPHYRGLLDDVVSEEVRQDVYLSKWYRLVDLMKKALQTTCQTDPSEVEKLMMEAQKFEGFGFNVKHIIARLKEPQLQQRRLKEAKIRLEEAKSRERHAIKMEEMGSLKRHINDLGSKLRVIEKQLEETQEAIAVTHQGNAVNMMNLRKEVETAEANLRKVEYEVAAMNNKT
ncbi:hypothetical protein Cni_G01163 [Canna indica]|uniref:Aminotransferase-like plant mobile domain-containing protein n=1 Tax=Canna indica TaxID=4628 RepID=A0AAQ3JMT1_9LILI|nr:hypothetical protein Cni_G01163 [Canna indica]